MRGLGPRWADWTGDGFVPPAAALVDSARTRSREPGRPSTPPSPRRPRCPRARSPAVGARPATTTRCSRCRSRAARRAPAPTAFVTLACAEHDVDHRRAPASTDHHERRHRHDGRRRRCWRLGRRPVRHRRGHGADEGRRRSTPSSPRSMVLHGPDGRLLDATSFDAEPIVAWWQASPFVNVRPQTRTFVLAPDVRGAARSIRPAAPRPASTRRRPPRRRRRGSRRPPSPPRHLAHRRRRHARPTRPTGQLVTRIRLTRGCLRSRFPVSCSTSR